MSKFYGPIGFGVTERTAPGIYEPVISERKYYAEVMSNSRRYESSGDSINDNLNINNKFSILADPYAKENFHSMLYIEFMGTKWKITNVEVQYPRLILTVGGVYSEE